MLVINSSLRVSGVVNYKVNYFSVPVNNYPEERFFSKGWEVKKSKDSKFYIFKGADFLSLGNVSLICPSEMIDLYRSSMKTTFWNGSHDEKIHNELKSGADNCLVFKKDELSNWSAVGRIME
ncbi:hypothetical protein [Tatumella terrea]|uniref:Uncharacterized protein n=1 Tax=Tatumella terrea TaxID=419007 RepID=A0ABW1VX46_9GAMM